MPSAKNSKKSKNQDFPSVLENGGKLFEMMADTLAAVTPSL